MDTLVLSGAVTGKDLADRLAGQEAECIRTELGEAGYQSFQDGPLTIDIDRAYERPIIDRSLMNTLFNCLDEDNVPLLGIAIMDAFADGWTAETRGCVSGVAVEHPEIVYIWLGLEREPGPAALDHIEANHVYLVDIWECFTDKESAEFVVHGFSTSSSATGEDLFSGILTPAEITCFEGALPEDTMRMFREAPSMEAVIAVPGVMIVAGLCVESDISNRIFVAGYARRTGGLEEESAACVYQFTLDHPHYMEAAQGRDIDVSTLSDEELAEMGDDGLRMFDCLTTDELARYQTAFAARWFAP